MRKQFVDFTFDINPQALAVAHYLEGLENDMSVPSDIYFEMSPWYNGREKGICWMIGKLSYKTKVLCIAVFEHRNHDGICALKWERDSFGMNPPTIESDGRLAYPSDSKWDVAFSVKHGDAGRMADWVRERVQDYIAKKE